MHGKLAFDRIAFAVSVYVRRAACWLAASRDLTMTVNRTKKNRGENRRGPIKNKG
jgi:hypothetical protein